MADPVLQVRLYASNGSTLVRVLPTRRGLRISEELNGVGGGEVQVPASAATSITRDQVIKVAYNGTIVSGFVIESISQSVPDADGTSWVTLSGRGLMAWLEDAVVYPQGGLVYYAPTDRPFNYAAAGTGAAFQSRVTWTRPLGLRFSSVTSSDYRYGSPKGWPARTAYWIWRTSPSSSVADNVVNYFRTQFTVSSTRKVRFYVTADNYFRLHLDGALILADSDLKGEGATWRRIASRTMTVTAGTHNVTAMVTNGRNGSVSAKAGFLAAITNADSNGKPTTVIRKTDPGNWWVTATEPTLYPSEIVETLKAEAVTRGVTRAGQLTVGWSASADSSSRSWSTTTAMDVRCGTNLLDVVQTMVDLGVDFWADAATNRLEAYETRGSDKSASILLKVGKNLESYETTATATGKTAALVRSADGWTATTNSTGVSTYGRRETYLEFGNTRSETTAGANASRILARTAKTTVTVSRVECLPTADAEPFIDFKPGDRVTALSSTGTQTTARVLSIALVEGDDGTVTYEPELEVLA